MFDKFIQFKGCIKSASYYFCIALMVSPRDHVWQCVKSHVTQSRLYFQKRQIYFSKKGFLKKKKGTLPENFFGGRGGGGQLRRACIRRRVSALREVFVKFHHNTVSPEAAIAVFL